MFLRSFLLVLFTAISVCVASGSVARGSVSMYAIVAQPEKYIGTQVIVSGIFSMDGVLGRGAIYLDEASYKYQALENSILLPSKQVLDDIYSDGTEVLLGNRIRIRGTLEAVVGIRSISRLELIDLGPIVLENMRENR